MIGHLMTRRWLGSLVLAVVFAVVAVLLGNWQYSRHVDKTEARDRIEANYGAPAVPLAQALGGPGDMLALDDQWRRVEVTGRYLTQDQLLVRNRPSRSVFGYEVLVPFEVADEDGFADGNGAFLVDRGWVRNAVTAATLPDVPPAPNGTVTITGWLRPSEEDLGRDLPPGQLASINIPQAEVAAQVQLLPAYLLLQEESGRGVSQDRPQPLEPPDTGVGVHFAYALQWWLTAPVGLILVWVMGRRERREGAVTGTGARQVKEPHAPKPKKRRIWDDEDY